MNPADYANNILAAVQRFRNAGYATTLGMPWVFVNKQLLRCSGAGCTARRMSDGDQALTSPGSLLFIVCSHLRPKPDACQNVQPGELQKVQPTPACENCVESG